MFHMFLNVTNTSSVVVSQRGEVRFGKRIMEQAERAGVCQGKGLGLYEHIGLQVL